MFSMRTKLKMYVANTRNLLYENLFQMRELFKQVAILNGHVSENSSEFACLMRYQKVGFSLLYKFKKETAIVSRILEETGFEVHSIDYKVEAILKEDIRIPKEYQ